jgi:hypothetical protein
MVDVTDNVCRPGLATGVPDEVQYVVKKGAKACTVSVRATPGVAQRPIAIN